MLQAEPVMLAAADHPRRCCEVGTLIATVDWTIAETLLALGVTPLAVGMSAYRAWVGEPLLLYRRGGYRPARPAQPRAAGRAETRSHPHLAAGGPLAPTLSRIAPVQSIALYEPDVDLWQRLHEATLTIAALVNKTAEAEQLLARLDQDLAQMRATLPEDLPPLLVVQFIDERHVRVFGRHSLFAAVMQRLGLRNGWQGKPMPGALPWPAWSS